MKNILLTGGAGYVGSHTYVDLVKNNYSPIIVDNFVNSYKSVIIKLEKITKKKVDFYNGDVTDINFLEKVFKKTKIEAVIHFAALKSIPESYLNPKKFNKTNVTGTRNLLKLSKKYNCNIFVFSSSAAIYDSRNQLPFIENSKIKAINPYARSKIKSEELIKKHSQKNKEFKYVILRYFNPVGSHSSGIIGEFPKKRMGNLMPEICKVAAKKKKFLKIFGNNYNTFDGSCVRDFIHVSDLSSGHVAAIKYLKKKNICNVFNLGTGCGTSVLSLVYNFAKINKVNIPIKIFEKRKGDIDQSFADVKYAMNELNWKSTKSIKQMCKTSWKSYKNFFK